MPAGVIRYYKLLKSDGRSPFQDRYWRLPIDDQPGAWMPPLHEAGLRACWYGYHVCSAAQLVTFGTSYPSRARGTVVYEVELAGRILSASDVEPSKHLASRARLLPISWSWDRIASAVAPAQRACDETVAHALQVYQTALFSWDTGQTSDKKLDRALRALKKTRVQAAQLYDETETHILAGMGIT